MNMMVRLRRREESARGECGQPDAVSYVKRQRCDSPRTCVGISVGLEDRAGCSASTSYRRIPELTRGSSQTSSRYVSHCTTSLVSFAIVCLMPCLL